MDVSASKTSAKWVPYRCDSPVNKRKEPWPNQAVSGSTPQLVSPDRHRIAIDYIATSVDAKYFDKLDRGAMIHTRSY